MSSEQPEIETQKAPAVAAQADITQQVSSPTPKPRVKNPKRVAAGKMVAERTRIAREQQKKAAAEASVIIANNNAGATASPPEPDPPAGLSINQWIGIGGLAVSAVGLFLKREEIMAAFKKNLPVPPSPVEHAPPPVEPAPQRKGIRKMD